MPDPTLGTATLAVLGAVARGCRYGFDAMDATGLRSGTVYRALARLEGLGLVASEWEEAAAALEEKRPRRRYYVVTAAGRRQLAAAQARLAELARRLSPQRGGAGT
jgi:DNA-binding PadR family transcriptional regulator